MRVQTEEWRRFIPGSRMYKGKKTLFYNGEILWDDENEEYLIYDEEEQLSWEVVIVLPGVEEIPEYTFMGCEKIETVIMSDSVRRIEREAFQYCESLKFVKLSRNLEYIGLNAFEDCEALSSIFIPPSCIEIGDEAFCGCSKLIIFCVPRHTMIGIKAIRGTELFYASPFDADVRVHEWVKRINEDDDYELHRACSSFNPMIEIIYGIVKRKGLNSWKMKNELGLTPFDYLDANPFADIAIDQTALMKRYVLEMMGETM
ncbi:leucine-rich repeat domain-containing protein [Chaetoceros tenuissimus]|uniref:Leucine-rich repeat domain-containing protein n=1 Tax=Chaetoceros tenuissimus TaxID=426638 RepID=A0AAD3CQ96_9STRA|nr:leucine-rich repeat domain-containing protein [Chaetoceros tenuissimus]